MLKYYKIKHYLNRPHPRLLSQKYSWLFLMTAAIAFALILNHLQPYGLAGWHHPRKWIILSSFGLIFILLYSLVYWLLPRFFGFFFTRDCWTIRKEFAALFVFFLLDSDVNWIFAMTNISYLEPSLSSFVRFHFYTLELGILPMMAFSLLMWYGDAGQKAAGIAPKLPEPTPAPLLHFNQHVFDPDKVIYISKTGNYLNFYINNKGECIVCQIKGSMKQLLSALNNYPKFLQPHKSFVVNADYVKHLCGNYDCMKLRLKDCPDHIPVSRQFMPNIKQQFLHTGRRRMKK